MLNEIHNVFYLSTLIVSTLIAFEEASPNWRLQLALYFSTQSVTTDQQRKKYTAILVPLPKDHDKQ